jgi:hypothetical protein
LTSREDDFKTRIADDVTGSPVIVTGTPIMTTLTGGVFTKAEVGREGISRDTASGAFGTDGMLKPCALIRQRGHVPDGGVRDEISQGVSGTQVIEIYLYEDSGYTAIDAAIRRLRALFIGYQFSDSFPVEWINILDRERAPELGEVSMARLDFLVRGVTEYKD